MSFLTDLRSISSTRKDLISFGRVMTVGCAVLAGILYWRGVEHWWVLAAAAVFFLLMHLVAPVVLLPFQKAWMGFAIVMGMVVSTVILSLLFYGAFTLTRLIGSVGRKRFLETAIEPSRESYWIRRESGEVAADAYEKQF
jgi:hypothetical protein